MPPVYNTTTINKRLNAVSSSIDDGAVLPGHCKIYDAGSILLVDAVLPLPSAPGAAGGILTFNVPWVDGSINNSGTAVSATIEDGGGNVIVSGITVGNSTAYDMIIAPTTNLIAGRTFTVTLATITGH
jgi:hypothetical protein